MTARARAKYLSDSLRGYEEAIRSLDQAIFGLTKHAPHLAPGLEPLQSALAAHRKSDVRKTIDGMRRELQRGIQGDEYDPCYVYAMRGNEVRRVRPISFEGGVFRTEIFGTGWYNSKPSLELDVGQGCEWSFEPEEHARAIDLMGRRAWFFERYARCKKLPSDRFGALKEMLLSWIGTERPRVRADALLCVLEECLLCPHAVVVVNPDEEYAMDLLAPDAVFEDGRFLQMQSGLDVIVGGEPTDLLRLAPGQETYVKKLLAARAANPTESK